MACDFSNWQGVSRNLAEFTGGILEKAETRPYTWHSLTESANNLPADNLYGSVAGGPKARESDPHCKLKPLFLKELS